MAAAVSVKVDQDGEVLGTPHERFVRDWRRCKIPVQVKLVYCRYLADVSTVDQTFKCAIGFDLVWPASKADVDCWKRTPETFSPSYVPNFEFPNAKEETSELRAQENGNPFKIIQEGDESFCFLRKLVYLTCMESFELQAFPFDCQDLTVVMDMSFASVEKAMFVPGAASYALDETKGGAPLLILNRRYCAIPEFLCKRVVVEFASRSSEGDEGKDDEAFRWSQVVIRFQMVRRSEGYLFRLAYLSFLLCLTSLATFALDPVDQLAERIGYLMTLILATVALQYVASTTLPPISYLTLLDIFMLGTFTSLIVLLGLVSVTGTEAIVQGDDEFRTRLDQYTLYAFGGWLVSFNSIFSIVAYRARARELGKFDLGSLQLTDINTSHEDSAVNVDGLGILEESKAGRQRAAVNAFVSFEGKEKTT